MRTRGAVALVVSAILGLPVPAFAKDNDSAVAAMTSKLPDKMLGVAKSYRDGNKSVTLYWGKVGADPMIGVWLTRWTNPETWGSVRDGTRGTLAEAKLTKVVREADFRSERFPGSYGFYGEYETSLGYREVWILISNGVLMKVNASYFEPKDHDRVFHETQQKLFGSTVLDDSPDASRPLATASH